MSYAMAYQQRRARWRGLGDGSLIHTPSEVDQAKGEVNNYMLALYSAIANCPNLPAQTRTDFRVFAGSWRGFMGTPTPLTGAEDAYNTLQGFVPQIKTWETTIRGFCTVQGDDVPVAGPAHPLIGPGGTLVNTGDGGSGGGKPAPPLIGPGGSLVDTSSVGSVLGTLLITGFVGAGALILISHLTAPKPVVHGRAR